LLLTCNNGRTTLGLPSGVAPTSFFAAQFALPHAASACVNARLALFAVRRMGGHGLADAGGAHALFTGLAKGSGDR